MTALETSRRREVQPAITEKAWMAQVVDVAKLFNWRVYHPFLSKWSESGFPDLTLVRPPRLVFVELKRVGKRPTPAQAEWLELLGRCLGVEAYCWTPSDLDAVVMCLQ